MSAETPDPRAPAFRVTQGDVALSGARPGRAQIVRGVRDVPPHDHDFHEIALVLSGSGRHVAADGDHPLAPGSVLVIPPGECHAIADGDRLDLVNIYYMAERLAEDLPALWSEPGLVPLFLSTETLGRPVAAARQIDLPDPAALRAEMLSMAEESAAAAPSALLLRAHILKVAALIARDWTARDPRLALAHLPGPVLAEIARIDRLVDRGEPFAPSPDAGITHDHLTRLFRDGLGRTRQDYYQQRRIHRACAALLASDLPVTEVGLDLGFSDTPHFCRTFRRYRGMTPTEYRRTFR